MATAASPPQIGRAFNGLSDKGFVQISASAEAGIEGLTAHIRSYATGEELATVTDFSLSSGTVQDGVFTAGTRVQLDKLGSYQIDVDAMDTLGQRASKRDAGSLYYVIQPIFSALAFDHTTITYSRRTVQVQGTLTGLWPTDGLVRPISGHTVRITATWDPTVEVQTAADGRFTAQVPLTQEADITARVEHASGYSFAESQTQRISVQPAPTRFPIRVAPRQVKYGEPVTISGQLTWKSPDGWQPMANRQFGLQRCEEFERCEFVPDVPKTDADGHFSVTSVPTATGYYQVGFTATDETGQPDLFIATAVSKAPVTVLQPAVFADFTAARDESDQVVACGHIDFPNHLPASIPVQIQYRAPGTASSWATVAEVQAGGWETSGHTFSATIDQPAAGQWRAYYAGIPHEVQTAVSTKVRVPAAT
ncbi:hypothetical protein GCM10009745_56570 [Kribbella yunnanensis]|uniref:Carboxypeptidase regulatory-like domain-containing protein n=1 Tax=Kribbella yunnanensis TaxID=190194 RepID=A0ABN2IBW0_9ACTN